MYDAKCCGNVLATGREEHMCNVV